MAMMPSPFRPPVPYRLPWSVTISALPAAASYPGQRIWVSDLFDDGVGNRIAGYLESDGTAWIPERMTSVTSRTMAAGGTLTLKPRIDRPIQVISGSLIAGATASITFSTSRAWNGCSFTVQRVGSGLGGILLLGKILAASSWVDVAFDGSAFKTIRSGGLL
jgi:hypothetical protein